MTRPLAEVIKTEVLAALEEHTFNVPDAARALGISSQSVYRHLRRWGLRPPLASFREPRVKIQDHRRRLAAVREALAIIRARNERLPE